MVSLALLEIWSIISTDMFSPRLLQQPQRAAKSKRRSGQRARVRSSHKTVTIVILQFLQGSLETFTNNQFPQTVKEKANHAVVLDKATSDKLYKDVQSYRLITVATLVDRLKINGSLARQALSDLEEKGQIKKVVGHSKLSIYSR